MRFKHKVVFMLLPVLMVAGSITIGYGAETVEWNIQKTLKLDTPPVDTALSPDGKRIFVLTEQGQILIYLSAGAFEDKIDVGNSFDHIKVGPRGNHLILNSRKDKTVQVIRLDFIQDINVSGSPFKGKEDAPVVIAVFDDFE